MAAHDWTFYSTKVNPTCFVFFLNTHIGTVVDDGLDWETYSTLR